MKIFAKVKNTLAQRRKITKQYEAIKHLGPRELTDIGFDAGLVSMGKKAYPWK